MRFAHDATVTPASIGRETEPHEGHATVRACRMSSLRCALCSAHEQRNPVVAGDIEQEPGAQGLES